MYLLFDLIYYTIFLKVIRPEGHTTRLALLAIAFQLLLFLFPVNSFSVYSVALIFLAIGLKYIVRVETTMYDLLPLTVMLFSKAIIELCFLPVYLLTSDLLIFDMFTFTAKMFYVTILDMSGVKYLYRKGKEMWLSNTIKIRYIFTTLFYIYCILSFVTCIVVLF